MPCALMCALVRSLKRYRLVPPGVLHQPNLVAFSQMKFNESAHLMHPIATETGYRIVPKKLVRSFRLVFSNMEVLYDVNSNVQS